MEFLSELNSKISSIVWGAPMLVLMLFTGGYFALRTGFFQLRRFGHCMRKTVFSASGRKRGVKKDTQSIRANVTKTAGTRVCIANKKEPFPVKGRLKPVRSPKTRTQDSSVSQFRAMCSALAATLGTGNIAGVSTALAMGGAGAVFWMWISALLGMMTGYAENVLGIFYRRKDSNGTWRGGAMRYIREGLSEKKLTKPFAKPLSAAFAGLCVLASFGMGNMAQMNAAAEALKVNFGIAPLITGIVLSVAAGVVMFGGVQRIGSITAKIVPFMSAFYIIGSVYILLANATALPEMFAEIFRSALGLNAVGGGIAGYAVKRAVSLGVRRGVFSNEAGLGTSVAAHAASDVREPAVQGMWSIFEVFFDTIVMCSLTAFVLLASPCRAQSADEVFSSITTETQYFALTDSTSLITDGVPEIETGGADTIQCRTIYGGEFKLPISEGEITFSNVMAIRGIQSTDENGGLLWLDEQKERPLIETAEITSVSGVGLATYAFSQTFGNAAGKLLAAAVLLFAFSTVVGWSHFGAEAAVFLFGERAVIPFRIAFILFGAVGACVELGLVWDISDTLNGLMALPNLIAVLCLSDKVLRITRNYEDREFGKKNTEAILSAYP